ncbi:MAG: hypothetical protein N2249_00130 [Melioribacter sp.]|nr:hypothetical protein [Melioribacter sp.]
MSKIQLTRLPLPLWFLKLILESLDVMPLKNTLVALSDPFEEEDKPTLMGVGVKKYISQPASIDRAELFLMFK